MRRFVPLILAPLLLLTPRALRADVSPATRPSETSPSQNQFWFGVAVENIPPAIARLLRLKPDQGLMVVAVMPNSPAHAAGLKADDLLTALDDQPLTSQQELARAANTLLPTGQARPCRIAYLRDGTTAVATLTPVPRPTNMLVVGDSSGDFSTPTTRPGLAKSHPLQAYNYVLPNGAAAQVGPGYRIPLNADDASTSSVRSIKEIVSQGQTLILSQETDASGAVRNTITLGDKVYPVEPAHLDTLPPELRPLAQQLLAPPSTSPSSPALETLSLEEQVRALKAENEALKRRLPLPEK